jgi:hypothetical protein
MRLVRVISPKGVEVNSDRSVIVDYFYTVDTEKKVAMFDDVRSYITDEDGKFQPTPMDGLKKILLINLFLQSEAIDPEYYFLHEE